MIDYGSRILETIEVVHKTDKNQKMIINLSEYQNHPGKYTAWKDRKVQDVDDDAPDTKVKRKKRRTKQEIEEEKLASALEKSAEDEEAAEFEGKSGFSFVDSEEA